MFAISKRPTIQEIHNLYRTKKALPSHIVKIFNHRVEEGDKKINSFYSLTKEISSEKSEKQDLILTEIESYNSNDEEKWLDDFDNLIEKMPLFGIPFSTKAIIQIEGELFNASSKILKDFKAPFSSTVMNKIMDAGAILIGINNMDEFAMGASGESCAYGVVRNPFDTDRVPGGSSAGGAASVGAGFVVFSLGTDTGGSIRQPAAFTDTVGLKPTYGLVSRWGVMPMASSFDQVGGFTNNVEDNIIVTKVLAGKDELDQTTINSNELIEKLEILHEKSAKSTFRQLSKITKTQKPLKIGVPKEFFENVDEETFDPRILKLLTDLKFKLKNIGHEIVDISLPMSKYAIAVYYMTMSVEVASNLERIDGIRYAKQGEVSNLFFDHRSTYFGDEPQRRIMLGTYASSAGYYDAYYNQAQRVRELARQEYQKAFTEVDLIFSPTTPELPFYLGNKTKDVMKMYLSDIFTCGINPVRLPAVNVPLGFVEENGIKLPTGCQIIGNELSEDLIFSLALEIELLQKELRK
jgi:aspartyl-tRNA(Asn)/glutamyl-tRNA(Gln) amidotransferase subunit A